MGKLKLLKVSYFGDNYFYESPELSSGINIIEGENEHGKSTFMNMIYYGMGGKVEGFNKDKNPTEKHPEIYSDSNNYIELLISIHNQRFELTRNIGDNHIYILDPNQDVIETKVYRNREDDNIVFSDWILEKLNISVFDMYQGTKSFKLNMNDLFRLIYHDQKTEIDKIYKSADNENYLTDSLEIRKAIFEVLLGQSYNEYYNLLGQYREKKREYENVNAVMLGYDDFLHEILDEEIENVNSISSKLAELQNMYCRAEISRKLAQEEKYTVTGVLSEIEHLKSSIRSYRIKLSDVEEALSVLKRSIDKLLYLISESENEIKELQKIRFVNNRLKLFSPNTCPYCLTDVERKEGECICGNSIDESEYEKFFYTDTEYIEIIQIKKKSLFTLKDLLQKKKDRIKNFENEKFKINELVKTATTEIEELYSDINTDYNSAMVRKYDNRLFELKSQMIDYEKALDLAMKKEHIVKQLSKKRAELEGLKYKTDKALNEAKEDIFTKREKFSEIYLKLMKSADSNCFDAFIGEDYMPVINSNQYRARSTTVPKRLMYFLTLLIMSVKENISYPSFILIDTPNKEGIDYTNLEKNIEALEIVNEYTDDINDYQIILSTGINKYPKKFEHYVFETLQNENKLLKKRN